MVSVFFWDDCYTQEKLKSILMQKFRGLTSSVIIIIIIIIKPLFKEGST